MVEDGPLARILEQIGDAADRECLVDQLSPRWLRSARRRARRDALIRELGLQYHGISKVRPLVAAIRGALSVYVTGTYRWEGDQKPAHPRRRLLWAILSENQGRLPSHSTIRDALAGVQNSNRKMYAPAVIRRRLRSRSGTRRPCSGQWRG